MAPSAIFERIRKLEERGVIRGYSARLSPGALGRGLVAFVMVRTNECGWQQETAEKLAALPEVQEVHHVAGDDCFLLKVRTRDTEALGRLLKERFSDIGSIRGTRTIIVLDSVKETASIPVEPEEVDRAHR